MNRFSLICLVLAISMMGVSLQASSHREAPFITQNPKVDGTDFYMFRSYETGREGFVVIIANYIPLQDAYGGPNYFFMDPNALYEIHIDNNGDAKEDLTFQFRFTNTFKQLTVNAGGKQVEPSLINIGSVGPAVTDNGNLNLVETYTVTLVRGDRRLGTIQKITNASNGGSFTFNKPLDNVGAKTFSNTGGYAAYARNHIFTMNVPKADNSTLAGRVFVGQRDDPFVVNLGRVFDLINFSVADLIDADGDIGPGSDIIADANVTSIIMEIPISILTEGGQSIIGGWTTASMLQARLLNPIPQGPNNASIEGGAWTQVSRLGMPLVNELVIPMSKKDIFNASQPSGDAQFLTFVTNPSLAKLIEILFGVTQPVTPRNDLVSVFLTGLAGLNQPSGVVPSEMMRLNTTTTPVLRVNQNRIGVIAGDNAGYPNGRRPGDDVVDITLRAMEGVLTGTNTGVADKMGDGAPVNALQFADTFPFINDPHPGTPDVHNP